VKTQYIEIDGKKYYKPTRNLLGLAIIEYVIWFFIPIILIMLLVLPYATTDYNQETGEWLETTYPEPQSQIAGISLFLCWFIIGPIFAYFGVLTRPLLMRPHNIIKWSGKKSRKNALMQSYSLNSSQQVKNNQPILYCGDCGGVLTTGYKVCPNCGAKLDARIQQALVPKKIHKRNKDNAIKHIVVGAFWFILGLVITLVSMGSNSTYIIIMWGAIVVGSIEMIYGIITYTI